MSIVEAIQERISKEYYKGAQLEIPNNLIRIALEIIRMDNSELKYYLMVEYHLDKSDADAFVKETAEERSLFSRLKTLRPGKQSIVNN